LNAYWTDRQTELMFLSMWLFEEKQQLAGFWWIITFLVVIPVIVLWLSISSTTNVIEELTVTVWIVIIMDIIIVTTLISIFRFLHVRMDEEHLEFGYPPFIVKIPLSQIQSVRLVSYNFWNTGGYGVRLGHGKRWCYIARLGPAIEIDWGKGRKHAFSIDDHESLAVVLSDFLRDRLSNTLTNHA
jgi:hypothetical protein